MSTAAIEKVRIVRGKRDGSMSVRWIDRSKLEAWRARGWSESMFNPRRRKP